MSWNNLQIQFPLPTRANALVRPASLPGGRARLVKTGEGKKFLNTAQAMLIGIQARTPMGFPKPPLDGPLSAVVVCYFDSIANDIDGRLKSLFDAMSGIVFHDDKQICELQVSKRLAAAGDEFGRTVPTPRVEITIAQLQLAAGDPLAKALEQSRKRREKKAARAPGTAAALQQRQQTRPKLPPQFPNLKPSVYR